MEEKVNSPDLYFVGDIHGELETIVWEITSRYRIQDSNIVFCGDFGVGFGAPSGLSELYKKVEKRLEKSGNKLWVVRGNHDDPSYFDGLHNFPNLILLPDHVPVEISGKIIYPVGGGTSIDQEDRITENLLNIRMGSRRRCWWPGERIVKKYQGLPDKIDIVVSHEAPMDFEPIIIRGNFKGDIIDKIREDRLYLSWLLRQTHPKNWFHGHYHVSSSGDFLGCLYRGLEINEIFMFRNEN